MTTREIPTSGCINDRVYYDHADPKREYRFVIRMVMSDEEANSFMDELEDRGALRIRAEAKDEITFIEKAKQI
jgi:hypothetical protein